MAEVFRKPTKHDIPPDRTREARDFYMATRRPRDEEDFQRKCQYFIGGKCVATTRDPFIAKWSGRQKTLWKEIQKNEARLKTIANKIDNDVRTVESKRHSVKQDAVQAVEKARAEIKALKSERETITKELGDMSKELREVTKKLEGFCSRCKFFSPGLRAEREALKAKDEIMKTEEVLGDVRGDEGEEAETADSENEEVKSDGDAEDRGE